MSAWPEEPGHFIDWLASRPNGVGGAGFATRGEYGAYLHDLLTEVAEGPRATGRLILVPDEVVEAVRAPGGWRIIFAMGRQVEFDALVLATGNPPPAAPQGLSPAAARSPFYQADPWRGPTPAAERDAPVLLIGSGLTMVDVALAVQRQCPGRTMLALSRRGLSPLAHAPIPQAYDAPPPAPGASPLAVSRWLTRAGRSGDWRAAVDALRPTTQTIWQAWSVAQKQAFLRHARPYWDVHRHRLAPVVAEKVAALRSDGLLRIVSGRLTRLDASDGGLTADWMPRGATEALQQGVSAAVNCTGPASELARTPIALLAALSAQGTIRADPLGLGLQAEPDGRLVDRQGRPHERLFGVGPVTRGMFWECTAVPDIRHQATKVAQAVLAALSPAT